MNKKKYFKQIVSGIYCTKKVKKELYKKLDMILDIKRSDEKNVDQELMEENRRKLKEYMQKNDLVLSKKMYYTYMGCTVFQIISLILILCIGYIFFQQANFITNFLQSNFNEIPQSSATFISRPESNMILKILIGAFLFTGIILGLVKKWINSAKRQVQA